MKCLQIHPKTNNSKQIVEEVTTCGLQVVTSLALIHANVQLTSHTSRYDLHSRHFQYLYPFSKICGIILLTDSRRNKLNNYQSSLPLLLPERNLDLFFMNLHLAMKLVNRKFAELCDFFISSRVTMC